MLVPGSGGDPGTRGRGARPIPRPPPRPPAHFSPVSEPHVFRGRWKGQEDLIFDKDLILVPEHQSLHSIHETIPSVPPAGSRSRSRGEAEQTARRNNLIWIANFICIPNTTLNKPIWISVCEPNSLFTICCLMAL